MIQNCCSRQKDGFTQKCEHEWKILKKYNMDTSKKWVLQCLYRIHTVNNTKVDCYNHQKIETVTKRKEYCYHMNIFNLNAMVKVNLYCEKKIKIGIKLFKTVNKLTSQCMTNSSWYVFVYLSVIFWYDIQRKRNIRICINRNIRVLFNK